MIFSIDHIVFAATPEERRELQRSLDRVGFVPEEFTLEFPEIGASSDSLSFGGGGFVEFVVENEPALSPKFWFAETPRIIGLGFASDAFDPDTEHWTQPDAWEMDEDHVLPSGEVLNIHAAGPQVHRSEFYVFVMDRAAGALEFPHTRATPRLEEIRIDGQDAARWRADLAAWLRVDGPDGSLRVGDAALSFTDDARPGVRATLVFSAEVDAGETIPLGAGSIEIRPASR